MKYLTYLALAFCLISIASCSGEDEDNIDTRPPTTPKMVPHYGDVGDQPVQIGEHMVVLPDDNNGIDTVQEGQWIDLRWDPFIDNDLSHMKIYRFSDVDPDVVELAQITSDTHSYLDQGPLVERIWYSYFIELFDSSGNSAISDTVSYALLAKSNLLSPAHGEIVNPDSLKFYWYKADDRSGFYRVLVWNEENELIWYNDLYVTVEEDVLQMTFPILSPPIPSGSTLRWRVDYFDWAEDHQMYMGSESNERVFYVP